jgi:xylan 1,4-beta-xylosidase
VNIEGALTWAFTFENQPYFAGYRQLASNGLNLPVLNVFRMFSLMPETRLRAASSAQIGLDEIVADGVRAAPDIGVLASRSDERIAIMVWHYHDDDVAGPAADITLRLAGLPPRFRTGATLAHYRIDEEHSNSFAAWRRMGAPPHPNEAQYAELRTAGLLQELAPPAPLQSRRGVAEMHFTLPRQGVSLLVLTPAP